MTPRWQVTILHPVSGRPQTWDVYPTRERAEDQATRLRKHGLDAQIRRIDDDQAEEPEHRGDRRAFLIWALMIGAIPPERLTARVLAEIESETAAS